MRQLDLVVIVVYLVAIAAIGLRLSGRQKSSKEYFVGEGNMPWWTVSFSVVATETSVLTVISVPGGAYSGQGFGNVELALGYVVGRVVVATVLIPLYKRGGFVSAYQYLGDRFGLRLQGLASVTFVFTRLLAEGVRLFASAIPIKLLLDELGVPAGYKLIIVVLTLITVVYTYLGGIKAVIWTDAIQMGLYLGGALLALGVLYGHVGGHGLSGALHAGRLKLFDTDFSFDHILTSPFALPTAIIGGAIFAMASHGSDQLIVQRILATRSLRDGQKAMIGSGVFVTVQFAAFSLVGALLWSYNHGKTFAQQGLASSDYLYPEFILHGLPVVVSGLLVAGILGAAMGSLSSALNSMSNSTVSDIIRTLLRRETSEAGLLKLARVMTLVWAVLMAVFACAFSTSTGNVYLTGLAIAGYTYGALLGAFLLGRLVKRATELDSVIAFVVTLAVMTYIVRDVKIGVTVAGATVPTAIAAQWLVPIGVAVTLAVGSLASLFHRTGAVTAGTASPPASQDDDAATADVS
ncbi:sodium:solute symporter [Streptomyces sp. SL13]|uniref:Sodium:solute symporter n=1 Tax=Streptantibioticus silvisoli TaxID=2705255 RepID=A0AA90K7L1_9ACTN|nr:sodium:solute symporter [Streptantibioticus silvisoli]MDI5964367.1 sodium:solute symporter [Streptantibioticus silvisoli]MDI5969013.1 sodium:solute symporter [Streptantibioticus silvisoli]